MSKSKYILKRLLIAIPVFFGITILAYFISSMMPGGPLEALATDPSLTAAEIERRKIELGLNQPVIVQYLKWLEQLLQGNLGHSYRTNLPVLSTILERLWPTLLLTLAATVVSLVVSLPLGILAGLKPYSFWDYLSSGLSFFMAATPNFFVGLLFIYVFSVILGVLPMGGMYDSTGIPTWGMLFRHMIMPTIVLAFQQIGSLIRYMRGSILEVMQEDYIRTAKAKGLKFYAVVVGHALKNALIPIITMVGMSIPTMVGGAVVTEQIFGWPGVGSLMVLSINARDYPVIMGITVIVALIVLIGNLITDLVYSVADPRISYK